MGSFRSVMTRSLVLLTLTATVVIARPTSSQAQTTANDRMGLAITAGGSALPDALSTQCGSRVNGGGTGGLEISAAAVVRKHRWLVLQADSRAVVQLMGGCYLVLPAVDTAYSADLVHHPFITSTMRIGLETPPNLPMFRATAGAGIVWGGHALPVQVLAVGAGSRGKRERFLIEVERTQTRVHADEEYHSGPRIGERVPIVMYPSWISVRLGVELPL
jgi:hypothetical protein